MSDEARDDDVDEGFPAVREIAERGIYSHEDPKGADIILLASAVLALRDRVAELEERLDSMAERP